jgi:hypothetical protein
LFLLFVLLDDFLSFVDDNLPLNLSSFLFEPDPPELLVPPFRSLDEARRLLVPSFLIESGPSSLTLRARDDESKLPSSPSSLTFNILFKIAVGEVWILANATQITEEELRLSVSHFSLTSQSEREVNWFSSGKLVVNMALRKDEGVGVVVCGEV